MLDAYIKETGNVTILDRALPLAEKEMQWWSTNRTINVTSPYTGVSRKVAIFSVVNSAPRPEVCVPVASLWRSHPGRELGLMCLRVM
jgi:alpha,alpha-trehalase